MHDKHFNILLLINMKNFELLYFSSITEDDMRIVSGSLDRTIKVRWRERWKQ